MSLAVSFPAISSRSPAERDSHGFLLDALLREQQVTAVEKFAQWHPQDESPLQAKFYRDLIPLSLPRAGEQYAFEVDLDCCSGCQACVAACHSLNGLEEHETWRSVGLLHGGSTGLPVLQHVTTACHHCVEPACLVGCPVEAYEKDPVTGIVRHLDDQCIGCQYCILMCPYDVPQYSAAKGIVRKCDMCSGRLAVGEAPACVQACPTSAIRITVVNKQDVTENSEANLFLPGAPEPSNTLPTTVYKTRKPLPTNLLPADYYSAAPQHAHWPLVLMLILTQLSVGAIVVDQVWSGLELTAAPTTVSLARKLHLGAAFVLGLIGLAASTLHLGRPRFAYRAIIGWRTSWLSREVIAFGGFAALASAYAAIPWLEAGGLTISATSERLLGALVALCGLAGITCSTMIYASTRRVFWNPLYTGLKFLLSSLILGVPLALLVRLSVAHWTTSVTADNLIQDTGPMGHMGRSFCVCLVVIVATKLLSESAIFCWLRARTFTPLRRTALLMTGDLSRPTAARFAAGVFGGLALPSLLLMEYPAAKGGAAHPSTVILLLGSILILNLVGEGLERFLFFAAVVAPKMPGAPAA